MVKVTPGFPRKLPLFRGLFDEVASQALEAGAVDPQLALAIARMDFLRSHEKLLVAGAAKDRDGLMAMKAADVEAIILRGLEPGFWNPASCWDRSLEDAEFFAARRIRFVAITDPAYPPQLREVFRPPFGLYLRGRLPDSEQPAVAIVGTRAPTGRGLAAAYALAAELSGRGVCVVSGLARGIDSAAHRGAARGPGRTLAVLPTGIEAVYPRSNKGLAADIVDSGGGLATEYPPATAVNRYRFPERNRIIAGLARSCVVVEAPKGSGALITSDHALTEGRDVFVHGACLGSARNAGGSALASQGAVIVNNAVDVFTEWSSAGRVGAAPRRHERAGD